MKSNFHQKEFQGMRYNPMAVPEGSDVLKFFKDLAKIKEFRLNPGEGIDHNKLMFYIFCMYDRNSPYRRKFSDVLKRKIEVAHDVEFETVEGGEFASPVEDFLKGKNRIVNQKIVQYVILQRSYKYSYQVSIEAAYANLMLEIQSGDTDTKSISKLAELRDELENNL
ncbi:MAG: hypothetical protein ABSA76_13755, partial [Bacteroidales bacterium]